MPEKDQTSRNKIKSFLIRSTWAGPSIALFLMILISSFLSPHFLTSRNISSVVRNLSFVGIVAMGQACMLLIGELDISVGASSALAGVVAGALMAWVEINPYLALAVAIFAGACFGFVNGLLVTKLKLNSLVVTLGMMGVYEGINLVITEGRAITGISPEIRFIGRAEYFDLIPMPFIIMLIMMAFIVVLTQFTRFGRYMYAVGDSEEAAEILGINVDRVKILTFVICGVFAAVAGITMVARLGSSQPGIGDAWLLDSIAASVIGGVALTGGIGIPAGAIIGAAIMGIIANLIVLMGISTYWQSAVSGAVVILAISIDSLRRSYKERQKLKEG